MYIAYFSPKSGLIGNLLLIILAYFGNPAWGYNLGYSYGPPVCTVHCTMDQKKYSFSSVWIRFYQNWFLRDIWWINFLKKYPAPLCKKGWKILKIICITS